MEDTCLQDRKETQELSKENHQEDVSIILNESFSEASDEKKILLNEQYEALRCKMLNARCWSKEVVSLCVSIWVRSPASYQKSSP